MTGQPQNRPLTRYLPTYRLESKNPYNREQCEKIVKSILTASLEEFNYVPDEAESMSLKLSEQILEQVKKLNFDRYKLVCTVTIGEKYMQSYCNMFRCLWDIEKDGYVYEVYDNENFYAIACLYAIYCE